MTVSFSDAGQSSENNLFAVGQEMKAGDTAIVIEAMKMQSNYKVTSDCRIKEILVQEGDNITGDQTLITLEPIA